MSREFGLFFDFKRASGIDYDLSSMTFELEDGTKKTVADTLQSFGGRENLLAKKQIYDVTKKVKDEGRINGRSYRLEVGGKIATYREGELLLSEWFQDGGAKLKHTMILVFENVTCGLKSFNVISRDGITVSKNGLASDFKGEIASFALNFLNSFL